MPTNFIGNVPENSFFDPELYFNMYQSGTVLKDMSLYGFEEYVVEARGSK